jgi:hypothetical protein
LRASITVEQVGNARPRRTAHYHRVAGEICFGDSREDAIFFVPHMHEIDVSVAAKRVDYGIQRISNSNNAVAALYARFLQHRPHQISHVLRHISPPDLSIDRG